MNTIRSIAICLTLHATFAVEAQDVSALASRYDSVTYYPDSTVKSLYHLRKGLLNGQAIEFSEAGMPTDIGEWKRGKRHGIWISNDGQTVKYKRGNRLWGVYPGCGTGWRKAKVTFKDRYAEIIQKP